MYIFEKEFCEEYIIWRWFFFTKKHYYWQIKEKTTTTTTLSFFSNNIKQKQNKNKKQNETNKISYVKKFHIFFISLFYCFQVIDSFSMTCKMREDFFLKFWMKNTLPGMWGLKMGHTSDACLHKVI